MADVRKVYPDMFDEVYPGLLRTLDPVRPKEEFRRLFQPGWKSPEEHVGYALVHRKRMVGFIGLLYAEIQVDGNPERICNITSWIAEERYRRESISLLLPLRKARGYTVTNMSGEAHVREIFKRLGFVTLEGATTIMRPPLAMTGFRRLKGPKLNDDPDQISSALNENDTRIHQDHAPFARHLILESEEGYCYGMYIIRRRRRLRTALFHYISSPERFVRALPAVRGHVFRRHGALLVECDSRLLSTVDAPASFQIQREFPRLFKSASLKRESVPNLYSEVVLLNLE